MKKTKLFTSIAALALVLSLGACEVNVGDVDIGGDSSETTETESSETEDTTEGGDGEVGEKTPAPEVGEYFLGFDVDGTINYIDGETVTGYDYEGKLTTEIGYAVPVTLAAADGDNAFYLTFELDNTTYYVCIIPVTSDEGTYTNLQYTAEANAIYWDETHAAWVDEEDTYFLCYNSTFNCAYASTFTDWWGSSPVGELFDIPEDWEPLEQEKLPSSEVTYVGAVVEGTYKFGAFDTTSWSYLYISTGVSTARNHYLIPTSDWTYGANISITSYEDGYTLSYELGQETRYITYTGSSTAVTTSTQPYVWYYDSENAVFTSAAENGRFLGLAENADAFRAFSYNNNGLTTYAHAIPYTTEPVTEENPNTGDEDPNLPGSGEGELPTTYKLACLDSSNYCYRYFSGAASGNFLATTTDWDQAVDIYITAVDDSTENTCTLSFIDASGNTKYIYHSGNSETNVSIKEEPSTWVWSGTSKGFIDQTSNRFLCLYSDSMRAYAQSNNNAPALPYTTQPEDPEKPEPTETFEQVTSLTDGGVYYLGSYSDDTVHFITGATSNYQLATTTVFSSAAAVTATGSDSQGWKLTLQDGKYIYMMLYNTTLEFGVSSASTVPSNGVNTFSWNSTSQTLYTTVIYKTNYPYSYFEYYNNIVQAYGANSLSFNNAAHFYQAVAA